MKLNICGSQSFLSLIVSALAVFSINACSPASPKLVPAPVVTNEKITSSNNDVFRRPSVDILFVVDDSGSMGSYQQNVADNMDQFINEFTKLKLIDYHIGVTTTTVNDYGSVAPDGKLNGSPRYVDANTPHLIDVLRENLEVGTSGSASEKSFDPVALALSPRMLTGYNAGFYRKDAYLVIIFVTDAEDQSYTMDPVSLMDFLVNLKGNKNKILSYGALIPTGTAGRNCIQDSGDAIEIERFLGMNVNAGRNVVHLCDSQFGTKLVEFSKEIVNVVNKPIILSRPPIVSTIKVTYGTQVIPADAKTGWSFDPKENAIVFGIDLYLDDKQPPDAKLDVSFESAHFPEEIP